MTLAIFWDGGGQLHGATYTVDAEFRSSATKPGVNWVVDIGEASEVLGKVLSK